MKCRVQLKILWVLVLLCSAQIYAQSNDDLERLKQVCDQQIQDDLWRQYQEVRSWFDDAYREYPTVPRGVLESVSFQYVRFSPNNVLDTMETDISQMPRNYTVMGLTLHGKGVFRENARLLASMTPFSLDEILWQPGTAVKAYACAFAMKQREYQCFSDSMERYRQILIDLCELPLTENLAEDFAMNSYLYMIYWFLEQEDHVRLGVPRRTIHMEELFGEELDRLRSPRVVLPAVGNSGGVNTVPDYPNAVFVPAASCNYTAGRGGAAITSITIHYTQGTYSGAIAWFKNCSAKASSHYLIRSVDGQVTQMVREADKAWHVGVANSYTIGIEHEAYGNIYSYFTTAMYQSSANLVKNICSRRNINPHRMFYRDTLDNGTVLNYGVHSLGGATACTQIRGHQHYPNQTHTDPGPYWNWNYYYKLVNDNPVVIQLSGSSGSFTDSGGSSGDYGDDERKLYLIHEPGAESVTLTFQSFDLEPDYDFMWIYKGGTVFSPLVGRWNTQSPGQVTVSGDKMLVEFRSDCATTAAGWTAQWQANTTFPVVPDDPDDEIDDGDEDDDDVEINDWEPDENEPLTDNAAPQTLIANDESQWITKDFLAVFSDSDDNGVKWRFFQIMESNGTVWSARSEKGFLCDNFDNALNTDIWVNNTSSPWVVQNGELRQNNANADYVGIAARHNGSERTAYLYDFYLQFNSGDKCSFFFNCGNAPSQTSLFSGYEVCFDRANHTASIYRLILGAKRLLKTNNQVYFQMGTKYLCRVVFDSSTGEIVVMRHANRLLRAVDNVLATTSQSYIGFVTRKASVCVDNLRVYGSRNTSLQILVGSGIGADLQVQAVNGGSRTKLKSIVVDKAYKFSPLVEKSFKVDYTIPPAVTGLALNAETVTMPDGSMKVQLSTSWNPSSDGQSGIKRYYYRNQPCSQCQWTPLWSDNGLSTSCTHCNQYDPGQLASFSVIAENHAGLRSPATSKTIVLGNGNLKEGKNNSINWTLANGKKLHVHSPQIYHETGFAHEAPYEYAVFDLTGRKLLKGPIENPTIVDMYHVSNGIYLVRITSGAKLIRTEKILLYD